MLDNFPHVKAYWILMGPKLRRSVWVLAPTILMDCRDERVFHMAGAELENALTKRQLITYKQPRIPIERDALYNVIESFA